MALEAQSDEIGPNFNEEQFKRMLKRDGEAALQKKCKKISGDDNAYAKSKRAEIQLQVCIANWMESNGIIESYRLAEITKNYKPIIKK